LRTMSGEEGKFPNSGPRNEVNLPGKASVARQYEE